MALELSLKQNCLEAGTDEAGRGCLAGPVVAAAVILPPGFSCETLNDSKKLSEKKRYELREIICNEALSWGVGIAEHNEIDEINILNASILAMHRAITKLTPQPDHIIVDGNRFKPFKGIPYQTIIKGDGKFLSIAAASVLAKTFRDDLMQQYHLQFPMYSWDRNKGYPTKAHRLAIKEQGSCFLHRQSFQLLERQLKLDL